MKRITQHILKTFIVLSLLIACSDDFLDTEPRDKLTFSKAITSLDGLEGAILGVYERGRSTYNDFDISFFKIFDTDIIREGSIRDAVWEGMSYFTSFDASNSGIRRIWNIYYAGLNRANTIIEGIDAVEINEQSAPEVKRKNTVLGEALFFRAYFHHTLITYWDNIILADKVYNDPEQTYTLASREDVYDLIVSDLSSAIDLLPESNDVVSRGKVSKGVARHLLSLVYLDLENWTGAAELAEDVIGDGAYGFAALDQIFSESYQDNREIIFSWQFSKGSDTYGQQLAPCLTPMYDRCNGVARSFDQGGRPYGRMLPTEYYWSLFNEDDLRLEAWHKRYWIYDVDIPDDPLPEGVQIGDTVTVENMVEVGGFGALVIAPTTKKYWEGDGLGRVTDDAIGWKNVIQYRYSEAYLIAAEGYLRSGTNLTRGQELLDAIRARAGQDPIALNEENLLEEHARELGHEGRRYPMLKRLGILRERVQMGSPEVGANMLPHHVRWPIPQSTVDLCGVPQNEGY
ncbi:MAG: RagB/SusD family nutrient uptake outer membrane protein [Bacteroidales bacterium]|nr:RagB/SusD family nutrient uptake outer membrane protein [Bacteroidales bacterium]